MLRIDTRQLFHLGIQYVKFGAVGLAASLVHVTAFAGLMESEAVRAWQANVLAFSLAVVLSYVGHSRFTFRQAAGVETAGRPPGERRAFARFIVAAATGLALNSAVAFLIVDYFGYAYVWAIAAMLLVVPLVVFLIAKLWVFGDRRQ
ncbi:MAG: GtrA family protein [Kiloniellaceae bacterium]